MRCIDTSKQNNVACDAMFDEGRRCWRHPWRKKNCKKREIGGGFVESGLSSFFFFFGDYIFDLLGRFIVGSYMCFFVINFLERSGMMRFGLDLQNSSDTSIHFELKFLIG